MHKSSIIFFSFIYHPGKRLRDAISPGPTNALFFTLFC